MDRLPKKPSLHKESVSTHDTSFNHSKNMEASIKTAMSLVRNCSDCNHEFSLRKFVRCTGKLTLSCVVVSGESQVQHLS